MSLLGAAFRRPAPRNEAPSYASRRSGGGAFGGGNAGSSLPLDAPLRNGTLYAILDATSTAVSAVEWGLWRKPRQGQSGTDAEREPVHVHAALSLWDHPNPYMTREELVETVQQHIDGPRGVGYLILVKRGNIPIEMWFARPDRMTVVPSATEFIHGWVYTAPDGEKVPFPADEVIPIRKPNPLDPYAGSSPAAAIATDLQAAEYVAQYNRAFFENSAEPGGILSVEGSLNDEEFGDLVKRWGEQHRGVARAHRVAVVEHGMKYTPRQVTQRDMQFSELRTGNRDVIMEAYRISKTALGISDDVNRAAAMAAEYQFASTITVPRLRRWQAALNHRLLPMFGAPGKGVEFDFVSPVRGDEDADNAERESRATAAATLIAANFDRAAVLSWAGLPEQLLGEQTDPKTDLLTKLVIGAPSLAPLILPMLGFDLPEVAPPAAEPQAPPSGTQNALPAGPDPTHSHPAVRNADEGAPTVDLSPVQEAYERRLRQLLDGMADVRADWRRQLRAQITAAIDDNDLTALASLAVDPAPAQARIVEAMRAIAADAAAQVKREAAAQGVTLAAGDAVRMTTAPIPDDDVAATLAALMAAAQALSAGNEVLRVNYNGGGGAEIAGQVEATLAEASTAREDAKLGGVLTGAQNRARVETMASGPKGSIYADETLDDNTCGPCSKIDGRFICTTDDLGPYEKLYTALGGYVDCDGRERCRGTVTGAWRPATTDDPEDAS